MDLSKYVVSDTTRVNKNSAGAGLGRPKYTIFTLTMDRLDYTKRMLDSLWALNQEPYHHIIIDQNSTDGTVDFLMEYSLPSTCTSLRVVELNRNVGISAGSNLALDLLPDGVGYVVKIDNDCEVLTLGWDTDFIELAQMFASGVVLSPRVLGLRENRGGAPRYLEATVGRHRIGFTKHLGGIFEFCHVDVYGDFRYDLNDTLSGSQDSSFSRYVVGRGVLMGYVEDVECNHMDTTDGQHEKYPEYFLRRRTIESRTKLGDYE